MPTSPLPSRKSPKIMQILLQIIPPISHKLSSSLVKRSHERTCANVAPPIPKIPKKSCKSCFRQSPNLSSTLVISRQTLTRAPLRQRRPSHPGNPPKSSPSPISCFRLSTIQITAHPLSTIHYPLSTIHYPLSTIHYPLSTIHYPLSTIHYPLSTIHWCPLKTKN